MWEFLAEFSAQTVLKIFDYNLPYLEKIITVNPIIHWPHSITMIPFLCFFLNPNPFQMESYCVSHGPTF